MSRNGTAALAENVIKQGIYNIIIIYIYMIEICHDVLKFLYLVSFLFWPVPFELLFSEFLMFFFYLFI